MPAKKKVENIEMEETKSDDGIREKSYVDRRGRWRFVDGDGLVARKIAYNGIYLKSRKSYPLEFRDYLVLHRDKNKKNFDKENLVLVSRREFMRKRMRMRKRSGNSGAVAVTVILLIALALGFGYFVWAGI